MVKRADDKDASKASTTEKRQDKDMEIKHFLQPQLSKV